MNQEVPQRSLLWKFFQSICRIGTTLLFDLKVFGVHHVPKRGGVLLLSNHQSYLDPVVLGVRLYRPVAYMAKSELFTGNRFFAWLIRSLHAFPVRQNSADVGAIKQAIAKLHEGNVLNVYPEGSRTDDGEIGPILPGVSLILRRAEVPIVPVVVDGSFQAWPHWKKMFRKHPVRVMFGPPISVEGMKSPQIVKLIDTTLKAMLKELREKRQES